jgi:hypothetical protein
MTCYEKNTKKNERKWSRFQEGPHPLGNGMNNVNFFWGCIPKVAGMLDVMDNGTQVLYTWQTIDLEEYEQYWPKEQDPIFDLNEDCEVISTPRRVYGPYSTPYTQEVMVEALGLESPCEQSL